MFQDDKLPKNKPSVDPSKLKDDAINALDNKITSQVDAKIAKVTDGKLNQSFEKTQDYSKMFMNQPIVPNAKTYVDKDLWGNQPTSKIYNAKTIPEHDILGINRVVKLSLVIEGEIINFFKHFKLVQSAKKHHEFSLELAHDVLGDAENYRLENAQKFLGKRLTAIFRYSGVEDSPERVFVGVITEVGFVQEQGSLGNILLTGYSPTILLDAAPHTQSFGGTDSISLNSIADQVIKQGISKSKFDYRIAAKYGSITYSTQYEETHYNYLARMAEAYGEQFFYDGEVLHFGELPPQQKPITLTYGSSVNDIKVNMRAQHINPSFYGYNSSKNEKLTTGTSQIRHTSDIAKRAYSISEQTFKTPSLRVAPIKAATFLDISASQKGTAGSKAVDVFVTSGTTTIPFLYPGCIADIEMRQTDTNRTSYFTKLMITETTHEVDARGYYNGTFEAIAADTGFLPRPEFKMPRAEIQVAKVTSNTDPKNQGRVQVQFDWQNGYDKSEFIRVMTPDAGGSDKVKTNRGFMAIPEVGDQVMVAFQHHHPDRPFVMGGMFHGKVGGGGGQGNNVKSLSSKSGNIICLNDGAGIEIKDKAGNHVTLSGTGNLTTEISADCTDNIGGNQTINITSANRINIGTNSVENVGEKGTSTFASSSGYYYVKSETATLLKSGEGSIILTKDGIIKIKGKAIIIEGTDLVSINGKGAKALFSTSTTISGSQVDIN
ncbi:type VI secretion system Vgr family protein [Empedobacter falsenii]|uniref:Vgr family protein n=1 Tax=Empedobacter falsenii TaxID=343874 RepID=A0A7H9DUS6_9FLAO|nr:Vgr family protein [Empedobacter falsenii]